MRARGSWVNAAAALLAIGLVGCSGTATSGSGPSSPTAGGTASIVPGHATPADAVEGVIQAELSGNLPQACSYIVPSKRTVCLNSLNGQTTAPAGQVSVVNVVTSGNQALVAVTGHDCVNGTQCQSNTDPTVGMPNGSVTFAQAYNEAVTTGSFSPVPCIEINGKWYVNV
jgi:hypothetical protein